MNLVELPKTTPCSKPYLGPLGCPIRIVSSQNSSWHITSISCAPTVCQGLHGWEEMSAHPHSA